MVCRARFYIPKDAASTSAGQVDLLIDGTVQLFGNNVANPVYSYRGNGTVYVFGQSKMAQNCYYVSSGLYRIKEWVFNSDSVSSFANTFNDHAIYREYNSDLLRVTCGMDSTFWQEVNYDPNGFGTVAAFIRMLGKEILWTYYKKPDDTSFVAYLPASLESYGVATDQWVQMENQYDI